MPRISVVIPAKNAEKTIRGAVLSILLQDYKDFDVTVVDDGSTDRTADIVREIGEQDHRVNYRKNTSSGVGSARNMGIRSTDSEFVATMDADDIALPWRFSVQIRYLENDPSLVVLGSSMIWFGSRHGSPTMVTSKTACRLALSVFYPFCHPTTMKRRDAIEKAGFYPEGNCIVDDYALCVRLAAFGDIQNVREPLLMYRVHSKQISSARKQEQREEMLNILREHHGKLLGRQDFSRRLLISRMAAASAVLGPRQWPQCSRAIRAVLESP